MKIFLSAVSSQFRACRDALASDLRAVGATVIVQEDFRQHGGTLLAKLEALVAEADRVLFLLGDAFGWAPEDSLVSYSQWEYRFAKRHGKPVFLYLASPGFLAEHRVEQPPEATARQAAYLAEIAASGQDWSPFASLDQLRALVLRDGFALPKAPQARTNLPAERDAFVGRASDLAELGRRVAAGRLVTVLGIGGTGKTRLVTHFGASQLGAYPGGVWFCDLSEARTVEGIGSAVARALDVPLGKDDPVVQLGHAIAGRGRCLLLLDNFEQVAREAPDTLGPWLDRAPDATFVVTSREVLGLPGEQALALAPLPAADGVALFVARARAAKADFALPDADRPVVEALVKLLDGLPLAIELAAARVRVLPPKTLLARMSERFKLLASSGGRHTRQATLRGALDWSWDLLSADERSALAQLSVFEGGFTLEAVEAVLSLAEAWPMDAVQALVDKSLVRRVSDERFDLLVSVQEYAAERLEASGGGVEAETRHGAHFATFGADDALAALDRHGGVERRRALGDELDNVVVACRRSVTRGDGGSAVALLRAAWEVLYLKGPAADGRALAEPVASMPGLSQEARAAVGTVWGLALWFGGRMDEARAHLDAALAVARALGDRRSEAAVLDRLGSLHQEQGRRDQAHAHYDAALVVARAVGDRRAEGLVLGDLGAAYQQEGRMDDARAHFDAALAIQREVGDRRAEGLVRSNLGILDWNQGRMDEARAHFDAALTLAREIGSRNAEGRALGAMGNLCGEQGRSDEARVLYEAALGIFREVGNRRFESIMLGFQGNLHLEQGRMGEAHAHFASALVVFREVGDPHSEAITLCRLGELHLRQGRRDEARAHLRDGERLLRELRAPAPLSGLLCVRACLDAQDGDVGSARSGLAEAEALAVELGATADSGLGRALARARAAVESA